MGKVVEGDCLEVMRGMGEDSVDMCVTSPPYWGLRDYQVEGQLGLEKTPEEYIGKLVEIFREVRRVLRPCGSAWLNLGDKHASGKGSCHNPGGGEASFHKKSKGTGAHPLHRGNTSDLRVSGLKPKDLCMMPARVALALQADKWYLRSDIIWAKPNPMPESVTDRPTSSYEHVFLLTKSAKYFYDAEVVKQPQSEATLHRFREGQSQWKMGEKMAKSPRDVKRFDTPVVILPSGANLRNVWTINTQPYPGAHFATFPEELPRRCILAGTSAKGNCAECGKPWVRVVEKAQRNAKEAYGGKWGSQDKQSASYRLQANLKKQREITGEHDPSFASIALGWRPSCKCKADTVPAIVLDPFFGSGTVGVVAEKLQRDWIGIEISLEYIEQAKRRTGLSTSEELVKDKPLFAG